MRCIKPHYYDDFVCAADQCEDTCCAGWQIMIDETSLEQYAKMEGPFGNRLHNSIDWEEGMFLRYDGRCTLLNEENLCDLYLEIGEEAFCDTCRMYPRHVEEYEGVREYSLSLSCPVAAKLMLECEEKVAFQEWETPENEAFEEFDAQMFALLEDARNVAFAIIQNRQMDLRERIQIVLKLAEELQQCVDVGALSDVGEILRKYEAQNGQGLEWFSEQDRYARMCRDFTVFYRMEPLRKEWEELLPQVWETLYSGGEQGYLEQYQKFQETFGYESEKRKTWECVGEQLLMFFVYTYFCGAVYDDMVFPKMALSVFCTVWIQELILFRWVKKSGEIGMNDIADIAHCFAREVEHSDQNLEILEQWSQAHP